MTCREVLQEYGCSFGKKEALVDGVDGVSGKQRKQTKKQTYKRRFYYSII